MCHLRPAKKLQLDFKSVVDLREKMRDRAATQKFQSVCHCPIFPSASGSGGYAPLVGVIPSTIDLSNKAKHRLALLFMMLCDRE